MSFMFLSPRFGESVELLGLRWCQPEMQQNRQGSICGENGACSVLSMGALAIYILSAADIYLLYQLTLNERNAAMLNDL